MKCPYCFNSNIKVIDSRDTNNQTIRRRRVCLDCNKRFTTYENISVDPLIVVKLSGKMEPYDRDKIKSSLISVCHKRPVSDYDIEKVVLLINDEIIKIDSNEISSVDIRNIVEKYLKELDEIAFNRYHSAYN